MRLVWLFQSILGFWHGKRCVNIQVKPIYYWVNLSDENYGNALKTLQICKILGGRGKALDSLAEWVLWSHICYWTASLTESYLKSGCLVPQTLIHCMPRKKLLQGEWINKIDISLIKQKMQRVAISCRGAQRTSLHSRRFQKLTRREQMGGSAKNKKQREGVKRVKETVSPQPRSPLPSSPQFFANPRHASYSFPAFCSISSWRRKRNGCYAG